MKGILRFAALFAATAAIFCCAKPDSGDGGKTPTDPSLNQDLEFTLEVSETDATSAKIRVEHNGERNDTWYYFVTTESDIDQAILDEVERLQKDGDVTLQRSTGKNVTVKDLEAKTTYTFVAFGLSIEGEVYGTPADIEFTTKADITDLVESDEWTLSYEGRQDGKEHFGVKCDEGKIYLFDVVDAYYVSNEAGEPEYLDDYILMTVDQIQVFLDNGITPAQIFDAGLLQTGPGILSTERMASGYYFLVAIGYDEEACPTGTYSVELIEIAAEEPSAEYLQWIGTYTATSANGISYTLQVEEYDPNYMYAIVGWETGEELEADKDNNGKPDGLNFNNAFDDYIPVFPTYFTQGKMDFYEYIATELVMDEAGTIIADFGLYGWGDYNNDITLLTTGGGAVIATAETTDNGATGTITGGVLQTNNGSSIEVSALSYAAVSQDGKNYWFWNDPMMLPITLTKQASAPAQQSLNFPATIKKEKFNESKQVRRTLTQGTKMTF